MTLGYGLTASTQPTAGYLATNHSPDMEIIMKRFLATTLCILIASSASAGPFGLEQGMTLQQIGGSPERVASGKYKITVVPKAHSAFESYILQIGPTTGLCWIKAIGRNVKTSVYGIELRGAYSEMKEKLGITYGNANETDLLLPGSIWNDPKDWMMALLKKERFLASIWGKNSKATLAPNLQTVGLFALALGGEMGYIAVEYSFSNEAQCEAEIAKTEDSAL